MSINLSSTRIRKRRNADPMKIKMENKHSEYSLSQLISDGILNFPACMLLLLRLTIHDRAPPNFPRYFNALC